MSLVAPDTGVLIVVFRDRAVADDLARKRWRFRVSAVVHSELTRGADTPGERRYVAAVTRALPPIAPSAGQWIRCGEILRLLRRDRDFDARGMRAIQNDVLIALMARDLGLPLVTTNVRDFELIAEFLRGLHVVELASPGGTRARQP